MSRPKRLWLNPEARTFKITYGADAQGDKEIASTLAPGSSLERTGGTRFSASGACGGTPHRRGEGAGQR